MKKLFNHTVNRTVALGAIGNLVVGNVVLLLQLIFENGIVSVLGIVYLVVVSILIAFFSFALLVHLFSSPKDIKEHLIPIFLCLLNGFAILLYVQFFI